MENGKKKNIAGNIIAGLKESTAAVNEINKANLKAVRNDSKANFEKATEPDPGFEEFKEVKGLKNKAKVVVKNIKEGAKANSEKEKAKREEINGHTSYQNLLEEQREKRQAAINNYRQF